ncbi:hypothetical protein GGTG_10927 [Gaeumannomyces tritici R3-111a-1]|uniref:Translin-associated protein X n=1 Tax=Gaeumannomyces tritici (strain R3-111a-1) TaxID=644352 RepID=J3PBQ6_GAET3|nr:hypothetical protein GGTG_10927 [Gaeumannomyces tritici R3-111a-1]EJT71673.1 hypothetical protein GGTG_10927 [Gaeumannomyces tritici R3-111a-1]
MPPKRDRQGDVKPRGPKQPPREVVRNAYTPMFEGFRDELDKHHDRRERIVKASRDITALSKKIIFSLQRVRKIHNDLPADVQSDMKSRLAEVARLFASIAADVQGANRYRYGRQLACVEELVEALTFAHYLRHQCLMSHGEAAHAVSQLCADAAAAEEKAKAKEREGGDTAMAGVDDSAPAPKQDEEASAEKKQPLVVDVTADDFLMGVFDLSGEMMRFATTTAAFNGELATSSAKPAAAPDGGGAGEERGRNILADMQELGTLFQMLPQRRDKTYQIKMLTLRQSVGKVEALGYELKVRGSERPKGWMPDMTDGPAVDAEE